MLYEETDIMLWLEKQFYEESDCDTSVIFLIYKNTQVQVKHTWQYIYIINSKQIDSSDKLSYHQHSQCNKLLQRVV